MAGFGGRLSSGHSRLGSRRLKNHLGVAFDVDATDTETETDADVADADGGARWKDSLNRISGTQRELTDRSKMGIADRVIEDRGNKDLG